MLLVNHKPLTKHYLKFSPYSKLDRIEPSEILNCNFKIGIAIQQNVKYEDVRQYRHLFILDQHHY